MKLFFFGVDGLSYEDLKYLERIGALNHFSRFYVRKINATIPDVSIVSWTSFFTGLTPEKHGIFGFYHINPITYKPYYPTFDLVKPPFLWDEVPPSLVLNMPATYPARPINGILVSGFVTPDPQKGVFPKGILRIIEELNYRFDVDPELGRRDKTFLVKEAISNLERRIKLFWRLFKKDFNTVVFVETAWDRICHFCYDSIKTDDGLFRGLITEYLGLLDNFLGSLLSSLDQYSFFLVSDHGFSLAKREIFVNSILRDMGFLKARRVEDMGTEDRAFSLDPGRIYIHDKRFKKGVVEVEEKEYLVESILSQLKEIKFFEAKRGRDLYENYDAFNSDMPDIVLIPREGVVLRWWMDKREVQGEPILSGAHCYRNAVFGWTGEKNLQVESIDQVYQAVLGDHVSILP